MKECTNTTNGFRVALLILVGIIDPQLILKSPALRKEKGEKGKGDE
jgi:hypothetical protein